MKRRDEETLYFHWYMNDDVASAVLMAPSTGGSVRETINSEEVEVTPAARLKVEELSKRQELPKHVGRSWNGLQSFDFVEQQGSSALRSDGPPRSAEFALLMIPKKNREHLMGDLEEEYRTIVVPRFGLFWAKVWYWVQAFQAVGSYVWPFVKRVLGMAAVGKMIGR